MGHFLDEYMEYVGDSETPREFFEWAGLSLVAAALRDKIKIRWTGREAILPNLYVILLGPSGCGKETAITVAASLAAEINPYNMFGGTLTAPALHDMLSGTVTTESVAFGREHIQDGVPKAEPHSMWLIMEELRYCMKQGELAESLLAAITAMYTGREELHYDDITRTRGHQRLRHVCLNWLGGSTKEWFVRSVSGVDQIGGGLFVRAFVAYYRRGDKKRLAVPLIPGDHESRKERLVARLRAYTELDSEAHGLVQVSDSGWARYQAWYEHESLAPDHIDEAHILWPLFWKRSKVLYKMALLESVLRWDPAVGPYSYRVDAQDVEGAIGWYDHIIDNAERAYGALVESPQETLCRRVRELIKRRQDIQRWEINRLLRRGPIDLKMINDALETLEKADEIRRSNHFVYWNKTDEEEGPKA